MRGTAAVNRIEVGEDDVAKLLKSRQPLWRAIRREGIVRQGISLTDLGAAARASRIAHSTRHWWRGRDMPS